MNEFISPKLHLTANPFRMIENRICESLWFGFFERDVCLSRVLFCLLLKNYPLHGYNNLSFCKDFRIRIFFMGVFFQHSQSRDTIINYFLFGCYRTQNSHHCSISRVLIGIFAVDIRNSNRLLCEFCNLKTLDPLIPIVGGGFSGSCQY